MDFVCLSLAFSCRVDGAFDLIEDEKFDFDVPISPTECEVRYYVHLYFMVVRAYGSRNAGGMN